MNNVVEEKGQVEFKNENDTEIKEWNLLTGEILNEVKEGWGSWGI